MKKDEKKFWEKEGYDIYQGKRFAGDQVSDYDFNILQKYNLKNKEILEIGVGNGRDSVKFTRLGAKVNGIDISKKFISDIKKRVDGKFKKLDVRKISKWKKPVDIIYSRWSIMFLTYSEFKNFLIDAQKLLTKDGLIYISLRYGNELDHIHQMTNLQSLQMNEDNLKKALPRNLKIAFKEVINVETMTNKNDKQFTFVLKNNE